MNATDLSLPPFLDRRPLVGTFTMLSTFKNICEHQAAERYVYKKIPFVKTEAMAWGDKVHEAFEHRVGSLRKPLPAEMRQWENFAAPFDQYEVNTELKLGMTEDLKHTEFFAKDVWFRGKLDAVIFNYPTAYMADWKTGTSKYEDPFELACGAMLLKINYPRIKKVVGAFAWLKENRMGQQYDLSDFKGTYLEIQRLMGLIKAKRATGDYEKRKSGMCGWCPCVDCEHHYVAR